MFCPKCGTQNLESGRFCRNCGADLGNVSEALSGNLQRSPRHLYDRKGKPINWESAIVKLFTGIAFLTVAIILGITGMAGAKAWWFWMLIPGFGALGSGVAQIIQLKTGQNHNVSFAPPRHDSLPYTPPNANLPPRPADLSEVQNLLQAGNKIQAIKVYKEMYDVGLAEAKEAVERLERQPVNFQSNYAAPPRGSIYDTGDLTPPPSVTENTTRHLKIDKDGETMNLPKSNL